MQLGDVTHAAREKAPCWLPPALAAASRHRAGRCRAPLCTPITPSQQQGGRAADAAATIPQSVRRQVLLATSEVPPIPPQQQELPSWSPERPAALLAIGLAVWWAKKQRSKKAVDSTGAAIAASGDAAAVGSPHSTALQAIATDTSSSGVQAQGQGTESQETAEGQGQEAVGEASAAPLAVALAQRLTEQLQEKDLGRIVIVARVPGRVASSDHHEGVFQGLRDKWSGGLMGSAPTGFLLLFPTCMLVCLEGSNNQLMALLRDIRPQDTYTHQVVDARVISFVLDAKRRLFSGWHTAFVRAREVRGARMLSEAEWAKAVEGLETFVQLFGARTWNLQKEAVAQMLRDPALFFGASLPQPMDMVSLVSAELSPSIPGFLDGFDTDYVRYKAAVVAAMEAQEQWEQEAAAATAATAASSGGAAAGGGSGSGSAVQPSISPVEAFRQDPEMLRLACFYSAHVLQEAQELQQQQEAAQLHADTSSPLARFLPANNKSKQSRSE